MERFYRRLTPSEQMALVGAQNERLAERSGSSVFDHPRAFELLGIYQQARRSASVSRLGRLKSASLLNAAFYVARRR